MRLGAVLTMSLFLALGSVHAQTPVQPALPQATVNLAMPSQGTAACPTLTTGSNCIRNVPAGDATSFQNAINAATCGDTIVLAAGSTYTGKFLIPATSCSGWIVIESSSTSSLPAPGTRVSPANVSSMATISTPTTDHAIVFLPNSNHWRLIGLEVTTTWVNTVTPVYNLIIMGYDSTDNELTAASQLPNQVIFDRMYIHGTANQNGLVRRGILMDTQASALVDSYCTGIMDNGTDAQCIGVVSGPGPWLVQNNYLAATGQSILFGGAGDAIANDLMSDITIIGNHLDKNLAWKGAAIGTANLVNKNLIELKRAQRILIDGNVIEHSWLITGSDQTGACLVFSPREDGNALSPVQDLTVTHNLIRHCGEGVRIAGGDTSQPAPGGLPSARLLLQNNVWDDIEKANWGGGGWLNIHLAESGNGYSNPHDIIWDHNTSFAQNGASALYGGDCPGSIANFQYTNMLVNYGGYGVLFGNCNPSSGSAGLNIYVPGVVWGGVTLMNGTGTSDGQQWPAKTLWSTNSTAGFTNFAAANYQLTSTSPYHNAGTDGKDIGVWDWTCLNSDSAAAIAGTFVPGTCSASSSLSSTSSPPPPTNLTATVN